jgi:hypothetical protein
MNASARRERNQHFILYWFRKGEHQHFVWDLLKKTGLDRTHYCARPPPHDVRASQPDSHNSESNKKGHTRPHACIKLMKRSDQSKEHKYIHPNKQGQTSPHSSASTREKRVESPDIILRGSGESPDSCPDRGAPSSLHYRACMSARRG